MLGEGPVSIQQVANSGVVFGAFRPRSVGLPYARSFTMISGGLRLDDEQPGT
jgi:hypothetical protein